MESHPITPAGGQAHALAAPAPAPLRPHWLLKPGTVFLNHGSFGACPKRVLHRQAELRLAMEAEPVQFLWRWYEQRLEPAREAVARFVGARASDLVFVTNTTTAINALVRSWPLSAGDGVLTTNLDYNACHNVLIEATRRAGATLQVARIPFPLAHEDEVVQAVLAAVTPRTRLAMLDHVTSDTALVLPVARLIRELQSRGIDTIVDGAHASGMVPLEMAALAPAAYAGNLHKWVCAPKGAAFLWVREDRQAQLQPSVISHGNNRPRAGYNAFQDRFDWAGTFDPTAWMCAGEALNWMAGLQPGGWDEIRERNRALALQARSLLTRAWDVPAPCPEMMIGSMATIPLPARLQVESAPAKIDPDQLRLYDEYAIEVPFNRCGEPARRCVRISAQLYNHLPEYAYLAEAIARL